MATWYLLWCLNCETVEDPLPFESAEERGKWAAQHRAAHAGPERWRVLDVQVPDREPES